MELAANENSMNITDLGFDCLERCIAHLTIDDLVNVADSTIEMRNTARDVYKRMHGQKTVRFIGVLKCRPHGRTVSLSDKTLEIHTLQFGIRFLRCFGDLIPKIEFGFFPKGPYDHDLSAGLSMRNVTTEYDIDNEWEHRLIEYVNVNCTKSLREVKFYGYWSNYLNANSNKLTEPFEQVTKLTSQLLFPSTKHFHELFPKLRVLESVNLDDTWPKKHDGQLFLHNEFMANCFPHLEHLTITLDSDYKYSTENFAIALRLSPNIKTLKGNIWFEVLFAENNFKLWNSNEHFQNLEQLDLEVALHKNPNLSEILSKTFSENLRLKNLKELNVFIERGFLNPTSVHYRTVWAFPITCENLECISLVATGSKFEQFFDLLDKYPSVKKIKIEYNHSSNDHPMSNEDCSRIAKAFPLLEEVCFTTMPDDVVGAIQMFHSITYFKCFTFTSESDSLTNNLVSSLNDWSISNKIVFPECDIVRIVEGRRNK